MLPYPHKYDTALKPHHLIYKQAELSLTSEKQTKYYSTQDHDDTVRKKLIEEYPKHSQNSSLFGIKHHPEESTKNTDLQSTDALIHRLRTNLDQYQPKFRQKAQLHKITFNKLDLETLSVEDEQLPSLPKQEVKQKISTTLRKQRLQMSSQVLLSDMIPTKHVDKMDRQISALYKENRDVNLAYRRGKFMKIFLGKDWESPSSL